MVQLFRLFVIVHIVAGAIGLVSFWIPVGGRKGGPMHRRAGRVFTKTMLITGCAAIGISTCTILAPLETHPHLATTWGAPLIRCVFGWMMLFLATLTLNLAWYGWQCAKHRLDRAAQRDPLNLALQVLLTAAAINCIVQGLRIGQVLMTFVSVIGFATVATNLYFLYRPTPRPFSWLKEHVKALVGAGISVYTAFSAFGAVRTFPALALHPALWALPLVVGLSIILYQWAAIDRRARVA